MTAPDFSADPATAVPEPTPSGGEDHRPGEIHRPSFDGSAGEFFGIWMVNVLLTVLTLGIYLPWARVRTRRYFYTHTRLAGHTFEYTAEPVALLRGYALLAVLFVVYTVAGEFGGLGWLSGGLFGLFLVSYPLLVWLSLRFNARHSLHRGLRFGFHGQKRGSYLVNGLMPAGVLLSLGLLLPVATFLSRRYTFGNLSYGASRSRFGGDLGEVIALYLLALVGMVVLGFGALALIGGLAFLGGILDRAGEAAGMEAAVVTAVLIGLGALLTFNLIGPLIRGYLIHYTLKNTALDTVGVGGERGRVRLHSELNPLMFAWIAVSNFAAQLLTLGLATPWATVRRNRYVMESVLLHSTLSLNDLAGASLSGETGVLGEAATDLFGLEVGL